MDLTAVGLLPARDLPALLAVCALIGVALLVSLPLVGAVLLVERLDLQRVGALFLRLPAQRIKILGCALCLFDELVGRCRNAARLPENQLFLLKLPIFLSRSHSCFHFFIRLIYYFP